MKEIVSNIWEASASAVLDTVVVGAKVLALYTIVSSIFLVLFIGYTFWRAVR